MDDHADAVLLLQAYRSADAHQHMLSDDYLTVLAANSNGTWRECLPDHLTASALVVDPSQGRVLLGLHAKVGLWLQMGGHIESGDASVAAAALREAIEESGIPDLRLFSPVPVWLDRHPAPCSPDARYHLDVQFVAIARPHSTPVVSPEQRELLWCPYDDLPEPTDEAVRRLVAAARAAIGA